MIRRHLVSLYRKDQARGAGLHVNIDDVEPSVPADVAEQIHAMNATLEDYLSLFYGDSAQIIFE